MVVACVLWGVGRKKIYLSSINKEIIIFTEKERKNIFPRGLGLGGEVSGPSLGKKCKKRNKKKQLFFPSTGFFFSFSFSYLCT